MPMQEHAVVYSTFRALFFKLRKRVYFGMELNARFLRKNNLLCVCENCVEVFTLEIQIFFAVEIMNESIEFVSGVLCVKRSEMYIRRCVVREDEF